MLVISADVPLHFPLWVYPTYFYFSLKKEAWCTAKIHCYVRLNSYWILLAEKSAFRYINVISVQRCTYNSVSVRWFNLVLDPQEFELLGKYLPTLFMWCIQNEKRNCSSTVFLGCFCYAASTWRRVGALNY
jgi:hypothetical protein